MHVQPHVLRSRGDEEEEEEENWPVFDFDLLSKSNIIPLETVKVLGKVLPHRASARLVENLSDFQG